MRLMRVFSFVYPAGVTGLHLAHIFEQIAAAAIYQISRVFSQ
jgi:hypothetical protein